MTVLDLIGMSRPFNSYDTLLFDGVRASVKVPLLWLYLTETDQLHLPEAILASYARSYESEWEVRENKLYLTKASCRIHKDMIYVDLVELLFPVTRGNSPVNWFDGILTIVTASEEVSCISWLDTKKVELEFTKGRVISIWRMERELLPHDIKAIDGRQAWLGN